MGTAHTTPDVEDFCREQFPRLVRMLDLLLDDLPVAEELAQETLVRAATRWQRVGSLDDPGAWVRRVARNLATSAWRRRGAARRAAARDGRPDVVHHDHDVATSVAVRAALQQLSPRDREVLALRHLLGLDVAATAAELGVSRSVVTTRASRAAVRLRALLEDPSNATAGHTTEDADA